MQNPAPEHQTFVPVSVNAPSGVGGRQHRVGGFGRPNAPQLAGFRGFTAQFVKYCDGVDMGLGDPGRDDVLFGQ